MQTYSFLREFADSWFLIAMFCFFIGTWIFAFWPSLQSHRDDAANIPMRDDTSGCANDCANCTCNNLEMNEAENG